MLDYLVATALILLLIGHGLLIRGCFRISEHLVGVGDLPDGLMGVTDLLARSAEALDYIAEVLPESPDAQTAAAGPGGILGSLMTAMLMPSDHARSPQLEGEVHEVLRNPPSPLTEEDQPHVGA